MNRVCEVLGIQKPIIQGPMFWLTNGKFVGAVSKAGALGVLGFNAGQQVSVYTVEETIENMRREVRIVKEITDQPFGINLGPTDPQKDRFTLPMLDMMKEEGVSVAVIAAFTFDKYWIDECHKRGIKVVLRVQTATAANTKEGIDAGADVIVATGFDEGGTVPVQVIGTFNLVPLVVDAAEGRVPVIACGGITDERTAKAAFVLGAEGLYCGTAFLFAEESPMAENIKEMGVKADATDLLLYRTVPAYYRSLPGELPDKLLAMSKAGASEEEIYEAQHAYDGMRDGMLFGDLSKGFASFGNGISFIHKVEPAAAIVDRLMKGIEEFL